MRVSVIVPTFNRKASLERCLKSLQNQKFSATEYEIIVIADGPTDGTEQMMMGFTADPRIRFLVQSNRGTAAASNSGIAAATGDLLIFIDDDCICDESLIGAHAEAHEDATRGVVLGPVFLHPDCPKTAVNDLVKQCGERDFERSTSDGVTRRDLMTCANSSIPRSLFEEHWFNPDFRRSHDVELGIRLQRAGVRVRYAPNAVVYELYDKSADALVGDAASQAAKEVILSRQYPEFRAISNIAAWALSSAWKRAARRAIACLPVSPEPILRFLLQVLETLPDARFSQGAAQRLVKLRVGTAFCRSAIAETGSWRQLQEMFCRSVPVLLYHHVGVDYAKALGQLSISKRDFERHIYWLANSGYVGIRLSQYLAWRNEGTPLPRKPVVITFDDGYSDTATNAFPILERYGFSAASMIVTGEIGGVNRWDLELGMPPLRIMDASAIRYWANHGIEFCAHSRTHRDLRSLEDEALDSELEDSRFDLEQVTGQPVRAFAYPYGLFNKRVQQHTGKVFDLAFTTVPQLSNLATDPLCVGRIEPARTDRYFGFSFRVRWGWSPIPRITTKIVRVLRSMLEAIRFAGTSTPSSNRGC